MIKIKCRNLFCNAPSIEVEGEYEQYENLVCPECGYIGTMPDFHVLKTKVIVEQIWLFSDKILFRDLFNKINFEKLPKNLQLQKVCSKER